MTFCSKTFSTASFLVLLALVCGPSLAWAGAASESVSPEEKPIQDLTPTEVAAIFAEKLASPNPENPGAVAAELKSIWDANLDESEDIKNALQEESKNAKTEGNDDLAETLVRMIEVLNRELSIHRAGP